MKNDLTALGGVEMGHQVVTMHDYLAWMWKRSIRLRTGSIIYVA